MLFITGLKFTTATNAGILMTSIPVFAAGACCLDKTHPAPPRFRPRRRRVLVPAGQQLVLLKQRTVLDRVS